jgi:glycosyltransferase involved in cell wall biosynthesis
MIEAVGAEGSTYFVPRGDSRSLADRILELALHDDMRRAIGAAMRRRIQTKFSTERLVESMVDLILTGQVRSELRS